MRIPRRPNARVTRAVGGLVVVYVLASLASLLIVAWLFALLLLDSWGVSAWAATAGLVVAVTAAGWLFGRAAGLIRVGVALAVGGVWAIGLHVGEGSVAMIYALCAVNVVAITFLPNLAVKRYERRRSGPSTVR